MNGVSLLIIAGGRSSRLGTDKRFVTVGGVTLLENILSKAVAQNFAEIFLCVDEISPSLASIAEKFSAKVLVDEIRNSGPLAALANALKKISTNRAMAVSVDMPFFEFEALQPLEKFSDTLAVIPIVGREQPLAALYRRELAEHFSREVASGQRKILSAIKKVPHTFTELESDAAIFFNVNTPADLRLARGRAVNLERKIPIVSVIAPTSGTGKTTFIEKIIANIGLRVGVIKSDAHGFNLDVEGKDSWRFQNAGAKSVAVVSPAGWFMIHKTDSRANFLDVAEKFSDVDLILTEGRTRKVQPTISIWRHAGKVIVDEDVAAIFTAEPKFSDEVAQFDLNNVSTAVEVCKFLSGRHSMLQISRPQFSH